MIIHSPIVSGSLTFANGATLTPPSDSTYSGSFSGSFVGDGSNLSGVTSYTNSDTLTYINSLGVVSGSDQISLSGFNTSQLSENTNLYYTDARVKTKLNAEGVVSGSAQVTGDLDTRYLNTDGDNVVSQSAQIDGINIQNNSITIAGTAVNLNSSITFAKIAEATGVVSGSSQLTSSYDTRYLNVDGDGIISESAQVNANTITNFDSNVLAYNNSIGVLSGSAQLTSEFDTRYLNTEGDSIVSQSAQIDGTTIQNNSITIAGTSVSLGDTITFSSIASGTGTISGSQQVTLNDAIKTGFDTGDVSEGTNKYYTDARVKTKLNAETVLSGSITSADITDVAAFSQSGTYANLRAQATTKGDVGLGNVTNESKSTMFTSPTFTGTTAAPTPSSNDDSTKIATTAYVQQELTDLVGTAGSTLDTLGELSASLSEDSGSLASLVTTVGTKLAKSSNLSDLANAGTARTNLGVSIGSDVQAYNSTLDTVAAGTYTGDNSITTIGTITTGNVTSILPSGVISGSDQVQALGGVNNNTITFTAGNGLVGGGAVTLNQSSDETITFTVGGGVISGSEQVSGITNTQLAGSIAASKLAGSIGNSKLSNSSITIDGTAVSLGGSVTTLQLGTSSTTALAGDTTTISGAQASAITANTSKVGYTDALVKTKLNTEGVLSGSDQVDADSITNFDANVLTKINAEGVISGSDQISLSGFSTTNLSEGTNKYYTDVRVKTKLNADGVVSGSEQISGITNTQLAGSIANSKLVNSSITIDGTGVSLGDSITTLQLGTSSTTALAGDTTTITGGQASAITTNTNKVGYTDALVKAKLNTETVISGSDQVDYGSIQNQPTTITGGQASAITTNSSKVGYTDALVKTKLNAETVISGSDQVTGIGNSQLTNSSITINGASVSLGGSVSTPNDNTQLSTEEVQDIVGGMVAGNTESGISVTYDDVGNSLDFSVASQTDNNFTNTLKSKLDNIEGSADVTDTGNVHPILDAKEVLSGSISSSDITDVDAFSQSGTYASLRAQGTTKGDVGLGNVTNESKSTMFTDAALTGASTAETPSANDDSTKIATTAYVQQELTDLVGTAGSALDTLGELSASLSDDEDALTSLTNTVGTKLAKSSNLSDLANASTARTNLGVDAAGTVNYSLPLGSSSTRGGFKIGYSENDKNYPVELDSEKMYVNVPWVDTNTNTQLSTEEVQDIVGGMLGGTETGISVTYQDTTGDIDFVVASQTDNNFTTTLKNKLDNIEGSADVTDADNVVPILNANTVISGSDQVTGIGNSQLTNSSITINGSAISLGGSVSTPNDNTQLSTEQVQDIVGGMLGGTETGITVTYQDGTGDIDFVVASQTDNNFTNTLKDKLDNIEGSADVTDSGNVVPILNANTVISGSEQVTGIGNSQLTNNSITINGTSIALGGSVTTPNDDTQLSTEAVQDIVGGMFSSNTETRVAATYDDSTGKINVVVDDMTANDNTQLSTDAVQDIVGAMFTGNTETRISATYQDGDGTIDLVVNDMTANDNTQNTTTLSFVDSTNDIILRNTTGGHSSGTQDIKLVAGSNVTLTHTDANNVTISSTDTNTVYSHPTFNGDDFSVDTGVLSGATVVSDIDINVTTNGQGHVTDANGSVSTRELTLGDLGYTGDTDANNYVLPTNLAGDDIDIDTTLLSGATVISDLDINITTNTSGLVTDANGSVATRTLTLGDLGYTGASDANNYSHPTFDGDDIAIDTGALTGATVISDLDFNITTNTDGHVTDANGSIATRTLTLANLGYTGASDANKYVHPTYDGDDISIDTSGASVIDTLTITTDTSGHVTDASATTRTLTATNIGLGNVTNESKATMFSGAALTSNPTAPTQTGTNSSTRIATTAFVQGRIDAIIGTAGSTLDTLGELSASLDSDSGSLASLVTTVGGKLQKDQNLSDLTNAATARTNLGLGSVANTTITVDSTSVSDGTNTFNKATLSSLSTDAFDEDGTYTSLRAQGTTKGDVGLGSVENTALSTYTGNGGALDNQYIANGANYISSFDITSQTDSKYLRSNATDTASGIITFSNTASSSNKTTGAVIVTGGVGIGGALNVGGDVVAYASSDERLKDNIELISNPIEKVQSLKGVTWNWNDNADELQQSLPNVGVIAQDVEKVLPQLVTDRDNGYKGVDYAKLTGLLIEAIKEQQKEIDILKEKLK